MSLLARLCLIPLDEVDAFWPVLLPFFDRIRDKIETDITPESILERARNQNLLLWAIVDDGFCGAAATGEMDRDGVKVAFVEALGGEIEWIGPVITDFEQRAHRAGASIVRVHGRRGWQRILKKYGYHPAGEDATEKELDDG